MSVSGPGEAVPPNFTSQSKHGLKPGLDFVSILQVKSLTYLHFILNQRYTCYTSLDGFVFSSFLLI